MTTTTHGRGRGLPWGIILLGVLLLVLIGMVLSRPISLDQTTPNPTPTDTCLDASEGGQIPEDLFRGDEGFSKVEDIMKLKDGEGRVDKTTGLTRVEKPRGPSFFNEGGKGSITQYNKGIPRKVKAISSKLRFELTDKTKGHYELIPKCPMTREEFQRELEKTQLYE